MSDDNDSGEEQQTRVLMTVDRPNCGLPKLRDRLDDEGLPMAPPPLEPNSSEFGGWNPMDDDFYDPSFNSYTRGPGKDLPKERRRSSKKDPVKSPGVEAIKLYVTGIPNAMTQEGLANLFSEHGKVVEAQKCRSKKPDSMDTFGFVTYEKVREAEVAMRMLNGFQIEKCIMRVQPFKSPEERKREWEARERSRKFVQNLHCGDEPGSDEDEFPVGPSFETEKGQGDSSGTSSRPSAAGGKGLGRAQLLFSAAGVAEPIVGKKDDKFKRASNPAKKDGDVSDIAAVDDNNQLTPDTQSTSSTGQPDTGYSSSISSAATSGRLLVPAKQVEPNPGKPCLNCGKLGNSRCQRCKAPYCSKECQRNDWDQHKRVCASRPKPTTNTFEEDFESRFEVHVDGLQEELEKMGLFAQAQDTERKPAVVRFMVKDLPESKPPVEMFEGVVMDYSSPSDFCLVKKQDIQLLREQEELLYRLYGESDPVEGYQPEVGELCAAFSTDFTAWYRARVDRLLPDDRVHVSFVDYGTPDEVLVANTRPIHKDLTLYPILGMKCALAGVVPKTANMEWSAEAVKLMGEQMTLYKVMDVQYIKTAQGKLYVNLCTQETNVNLASLLVEAYHAKKVEVKPKTPTKPPVTDTNQLNGSSPQSRSPPEGSTTSKQGRPSSQSKTPPTSQRSTPPEYQPPPTNMSVARYLQPGMPAKIRVVEVQSPSLFWAQCPEENSFRELDELVADMTRHYNRLPQKTGFTPQMKCLYAAKFPVDDHWYRAQVLSFDTNTVEALFIDYGNKERLTFDRVRALESPHGSLTLQAMACGLAGFPPDKKWSHEEKKKFVQLLQDANLEPDATVSAKSEGYVMLELRNPQTGAPFATEMLALARKTEQSAPEEQNQVEQLPRPEQSRPKKVIQADAQRTPHPQTQVEPEEPQEVYWAKQLPDRISPPIGKVMLVHMLAAPSIHELQIQLLQDEPADLMRELLMILKTYSTSADPLNQAPQVGQLVCCPVCGDGEPALLFRAEVKQVYGERKFQVMYLDLGFMEDVFLGSMYAPDDRLLAFPPMALPCRLQGLVQTDRPWNPNRLEAEKFCMTVISENKGVYEIELEDDKRESVNDELIKEGYAKRERHVRHQTPERTPGTPSKQATRDAGEKSKEPVSHTAHQSRDQQRTASPAGHHGVRKHSQGHTPTRPAPSREPQPEPLPAAEKPSRRIKIDDLPKLKLPDKDFVHVSVVYAPDVRNIWVQLHDEGFPQQLNNVMMQIMKHKPQQEQYKPEQGEIVLGQFSLDKNWYRAMVLDVAKQIHVHFIDFGNEEVVRPSEVAPLQPATVANYPPFAIRCQLMDIKHTDMQWEPKVLENRTFWMKVISTKTDSYDVQLFDIDHDQDVRTMLVKAGFVQKISRSVPAQQTDNQPDLSRQDTNKYPSPAHEEQNAINDSKSAVPEPKKPTRAEPTQQAARTQSRQQPARFEQQSAKPDPRQTQESGRSVLQTLLQKMKEGGTDDSESRVMYTDVPMQTFPTREVVGVCSFAISPEDIYLQLVVQGNTERFGQYLRSMMRYDEVKHPYIPKVGELVAARSRDDKIWYRAHVLEVTSKLISVTFTDFGNTEYVSFASVQKLDKEFTDLPYQAIKCTLADVDPTSQSFDPTDFVERQFIVKLMGTDGGTNYVELYNDDKNYNELIVEHDRRTKINQERLPDDQVQVLVNHVETPDRFFVVMRSKAPQLAQVMEGMMQCYRTKATSHQPRVDEAVAVFVEEDQAWYRAKVLQVMPDTISASLIDFGPVKIVPIQHVRWLEGRFRQLPGQAVTCALSGVHGKATVQWSAQENEAFRSLLTQKVRVFKLKVVARHDSLVDVNMWDGQQSVASIMVQKGIAQKPGTEKTASVTSTNQSPAQPTQTDRGTTERDNTYQPAEKTGYQSQSRQRARGVETEQRGHDQGTTTSTRGNQDYSRRDGRGDQGPRASGTPKQGGGSYHGGASRNEEVQQHEQKHHVRPTTSLTFSDLPHPRLPATFSGVVYELVSPWEIYIVRASQEVLQTQAQLTNGLNKLYQNKLASEDLVPIPTQLVAARYTDGDWYRAVVLSVDSPTKVHVRYLEFGNSAQVPPTDLRPLAADFTKLPPQSVRCSLEAVLPKGGEQTWSKACCSYLHKLINQKAVQVTVLDEMANPPTVNLDLPSHERSMYVNVRSNLVNQGHAIQHGP